MHAHPSFGILPTQATQTLRKQLRNEFALETERCIAEVLKKARVT